MFDFEIDVAGRKTRVAVKMDLLSEVGELLRASDEWSSSPQAVIITDKQVSGIYGARVQESLRATGFRVLEYCLEPGEGSKSLGSVGEVYHFLTTERVARDAVIVALGGGVVSDLAGFAAATWMRGIRFAICPTTVEADVDASLGGKTAINVAGGKNLVGAFHQPILVAVDPVCLGTLDPRDVRAGLAESIKHALITSEEFLAWHEGHVEQILALEQSVTAELILGNLRIKARIVEQDPHEQGTARVLLNFGHTIGHAIESCSRFELRHGECVALGMVAAARVSHAMGLLDESVVSRMEALLGRFGLPTALRQRIDRERMMAALRSDKKIRGGAQRFVLLEALGRPVVRADVREQDVSAAVESLLP